MPSILTELIQATTAGNIFSSWTSSDDLCLEAQHQNPPSHSAREKGYAGLSLACYLTPVVLISLRSIDYKIRALQLTVWTLVLLCVKNTSLLLKEAIESKLPSLKDNRYLSMASLMITQLEAQLLPLFSIQAVFFTIFMNVYHVNQPSDDSYMIFLQHIPSWPISTIRPHLIPGHPHPDELIRKKCNLTNLFMLCWSLASIFSGICAYGPSFCYKNVSRTEKYTVYVCYILVNAIRAPATYLFHKTTRSIADRACQKESKREAETLTKTLLDQTIP